MLCGCLSCALVAKSPSPLNPLCPVPATVRITPVFISILRTTWFIMSTTKRSPALSKRISWGKLKVASMAGPPSPVKPFFPLPAMVVVIPFASIRRIRCPVYSQNQMAPSGPRITPNGLSNIAFFAGPPSPSKP